MQPSQTSVDPRCSWISFVGVCLFVSPPKFHGTLFDWGANLKSPFCRRHVGRRVIWLRCALLIHAFVTKFINQLEIFLFLWKMATQWEMHLKWNVKVWLIRSVWHKAKNRKFIWLSMEMWFARKLGTSINIFVFVNLAIREGSGCMPQECQASAVNPNSQNR